MIDNHVAFGHQMLETAAKRSIQLQYYARELNDQGQRNNVHQG